MHLVVLDVHRRALVEERLHDGGVLLQALLITGAVAPGGRMQGVHPLLSVLARSAPASPSSRTTSLCP